ncbi:hypothetical protein [Rhodopseudomonas palustris]|uniref:hypothetical protein n=1 Tax=Rhodopseudomonas palustris TaxID=1076 RepID=UPI00105804E1|nr:hypothetical protein [Rhodopseudomonas palustris]
MFRRVWQVAGATANSLSAAPAAEFRAVERGGKEPLAIALVPETTRIEPEQSASGVIMRWPFSIGSAVPELISGSRRSVR